MPQLVEKNEAAHLGHTLELMGRLGAEPEHLTRARDVRWPGGIVVGARYERRSIQAQAQPVARVVRVGHQRRVLARLLRQQLPGQVVRPRQRVGAVGCRRQPPGAVVRVGPRVGPCVKPDTRPLP